jgi:hypothetical protein
MDTILFYVREYQLSFHRIEQNGSYSTQKEEDTTGHEEKMEGWRYDRKNQKGPAII